MAAIKNEIKKTLYLPFVCVSCFGILAMCLLSVAYMGGMGKTYTVIELIVSMDRESMLTDISLNRFAIWKAGLGTWTRLLLPFLLSVGYLYVLSAERQSGAIRTLLFRENHFKYCLSKIVSAIISGGVLLVIGYLLYGLVTVCFFPAPSAYSPDNVSMWMEIECPRGVGVFILQQIVNVFLYGAFVNVFAAGISIFFVDRYMLLSLPIMLGYVWSQFTQKLQTDALAREDYTFMERIQIFETNNLLQREWTKNWYATTLFMFVLYVLVFLLFYIVMKRRGDSGDWT